MGDIGLYSDGSEGLRAAVSKPIGWRLIVGSISSDCIVDLVTDSCACKLVTIGSLAVLK